MNLSMPIIVVVLLLVVVSSIKILKEYERGVMFTLGRFTGVKGPGVRRLGEGQRSGVLSRCRSREGYFAGR
jgi:hypothetical protein